MKKLDFLFFNPSHINSSSGPEVLLLNIIPELARRGFKIGLISTDFMVSPNISNEPEEGIKKYLDLYQVLPAQANRALNFSLLTQAHKARYFLAWSRPVLVDLLSAIAARISGSASALRLSVHPWTNSKIFNLYSKLLYLITLRLFDYVLVQNRADLGFAKKLGVRKDKIIFLPNIVSRDFIKNPPTPKKPAQKLKVVYVGRLDPPQKNIGLLLKVIKDLRNNPSFHFTLIGAGVLQAEVESLSQELTSLDYLGQVANQELPNLLNQFDIFLSLSTQETFGLTLLEAVARGLYIVTTDTDGFAQVVKKENLGFVLPTNCQAEEVVCQLQEAAQLFDQQIDKINELRQRGFQVASQRTAPLFVESLLAALGSPRENRSG